MYYRKIKLSDVYLTLMYVSFSKRLLLLFVLCSTLPLFLLSFVFSGISSYVVTRNTLRTAAEVSANVLSTIEKTTDQAQALAGELAKDPNVIDWCKGKDDAAVVSDLFQNIAKNTNDDLFQVYVVSDKQQAHAISRQSVPQEYKNNIYSDWGILHQTNKNGLPSFFAQPHPKSSPDAVMAVCISAGDSGFVIVDILREGLEKECTKVEGLTSLKDFYIHDASGCIAFSVQNAYSETSFIQDLNSSDEHVFQQPVKGTPFFAISSITQSIDKPYTSGLRDWVFLTAILASILSVFVAVLVSRSVAQPVQSLSTAMKKVEKGELSVSCEEPTSSFADYDLVMLIREFNSMVSRIATLTDERVERERLLRVAEIKNLQAQISPHFLYNTLNSIKSMAKFAHSPEIVKMVTSLGKLLRESIVSDKGFYNDYYSIEKSLELVQNYFDIESMRWENKFEFVEEIDPELLSYPIPRLVLQPVVENALVHGLEEKSGKGRLTITGRFEEKQGSKRDIVFVVSDDGQGMKEEKLLSLREKLNSASEATASVSSTDSTGPTTPSDPDLGSNGIALVNTHTRLKLLYGEGYGLSIDSQPDKGTTVTIRLREEV